MTGFDKIFLLSLKRTPDRYLQTLSHLKEFGFSPEVVFALDGTVTGLRTEHTYDRDNPGTNYRIGCVTIAMHLSHMMMWAAALHQPNGDSFLFFEDDVRLDPDFGGEVDMALRHIPSDWDMLYPGSCCAYDKNPKMVYGRLHKVDCALCTHAYAIRRKALPLILERCQKVYAGVDLALALDCAPSLNVFAILPRVANQLNTVIPP